MPPHRAERLLGRIAGDAVRTAGVLAPPRVTAMRWRAQYDERIVVIGIRTVVPRYGRVYVAPSLCAPRLVTTVLGNREIQRGVPSA